MEEQNRNLFRSESLKFLRRDWLTITFKWQDLTDFYSLTFYHICLIKKEKGARVGVNSSVRGHVVGYKSCIPSFGFLPQDSAPAPPQFSVIWETLVSNGCNKFSRKFTMDKKKDSRFILINKHTEELNNIQEPELYKEGRKTSI